MIYNNGDIVISAVKKQHKKQITCNIGDKLTVISQHDNVLIVELNNNRFSIHVNDIRQ